MFILYFYHIFQSNFDEGYNLIRAGLVKCFAPKVNSQFGSNSLGMLPMIRWEIYP